MQYRRLKTKTFVKLISLFFVFLLATGFKANDLTTPLKNGRLLFKNLYDGYSLELPQGASIDISDSYKKTEIDLGDTNLKVFIDNFSDKDYLEYRDYSLLGIKANTLEHKIKSEGGMILSGKEAYKISFTRPELGKVEGDKNKYLIVFVKLGEKKALTFMAKSSNEINEEELMKIFESFKENVNKIDKPVRKVEKKFTFQNENLLGGENLSEQTQRMYIDSFLTKGTKWGIFLNSFWKDSKVSDFSDYINYDLDYMLLYHGPDSYAGELDLAIDYCKNKGKFLEYTFQPEYKSGLNQTYEILQGKFDSKIRELGKSIANKKYPTMFRLSNEMNGDWCCYSAYNTCLDADIYLELYNYFYKIFEEEGANKYLIYIFNPNGRSFPDFTYNHESLYRPDKDKYDIVGLTLYNTGTYYPDENWETFDELYKDLYDYVDKNYDRPMMITEFSSSITGGDKMAWTEDMFKSIANYPKIKLAIWFSGTDYDAFGNPARIYNIDEPKELLDVFKKYLGKSLDKEESI